MLKVIVSHSDDVDAIDAIEEIIEDVREQLDGLVPQAGLLFCGLDFEYDVLLEELYNEFPDIELIGGTTDGEVSSTLGYEQGSVVLTLFVSDTVEIKAGVGKHLSEDIDLATKTAVEQASSKMDTDVKFCFTVYESLTCSAVVVLESLKHRLGVDITVLGGLAADDWNMRKTFQFYNNEVLSDSVPLLLFGGQVEFSYGVASGWEPIGVQKVVTKVDHNVVHELDGAPILDFYNHYLGEYSTLTSNYPLAVFPDVAAHDKFYLRNPAGVVDGTTSIAFFGDIPLHATVQLTEATSEKIVEAVETAVNMAVGNFGDAKLESALVISCSGRCKVLGINTREEIALLQSKLPDDCSISGLYGYGEIAPLGKGMESQFHNGTIVVILLGESHV
mgnify:FL=1